MSLKRWRPAFKAAWSASIVNRGVSAAGLFPQETRLLPIIARPPLTERNDVQAIHSMQIWSPAAGKMIPLDQVASGAEIDWEDPVVQRRDRVPTITVHADPRYGLPSQLFKRVRGQDRADPIAPGLFASNGAVNTRILKMPAPPWPSRCRWL